MIAPSRVPTTDHEQVRPEAPSAIGRLPPNTSGRTAALAGRVRIALALLGLLSAELAPELASRRAFALYLGTAVAFQWAIGQRWVRTAPRTVVMGLCDTLFLS